MSRRDVEPTGLPGGDEEGFHPSALLLCPSLGKKYVWLLQVFASSNRIHRETDPGGSPWESHSSLQ